MNAQKLTCARLPSGIASAAAVSSLSQLAGCFSFQWFRSEWRLIIGAEQTGQGTRVSSRWLTPGMSSSSALTPEMKPRSPPTDCFGTARELCTVSTCLARPALVEALKEQCSQSYCGSASRRQRERARNRSFQWRAGLSLRAHKLTRSN